jgi:hypothetical protein
MKTASRARRKEGRKVQRRSRRSQQALLKNDF